MCIRIEIKLVFWLTVATSMGVSWTLAYKMCREGTLTLFSTSAHSGLLCQKLAGARTCKRRVSPAHTAAAHDSLSLARLHIKRGCMHIRHRRRAGRNAHRSEKARDAARRHPNADSSSLCFAQQSREWVSFLACGRDGCCCYSCVRGAPLFLISLLSLSLYAASLLIEAVWFAEA